MKQFTLYNDTVFNAYCLHLKQQEIIDRKNEILNSVWQHYNLAPNSILFIGFNPAILAVKAKEIYVTGVSDAVYAWLKSQRSEIQLMTVARKFTCVVSFDEYLTFVKNEEDQKAAIAELCGFATKLAITTVKDYKNQDFKEKEYSQPAIIKNVNGMTSFVETHDWSSTDKNAWVTNLYQLQGPNSKSCGQFERRALFFKQLAKFSIDAGATNFLVHKNIMYKSLIKKNYEHIISISF